MAEMIAIHDRKGSFSDKWVEYCDLHNVPYKLVDCFASDIVSQLEDCSALMWHWTHYDHKAKLFARQLVYSLEKSGKKIFPDADTCWHFDDKVGQKYLLESIGAPLVPSYVFYEKKQAIMWAKNAKYPIVFKLRGGAGAENVQVVKSFSIAKKYIDKSFGRGFKAKNRLNFLRERIWHFRRDRSFTSFFNIGKGIARLVIPKEAEKQLPVEKNYVYFQAFIPHNDCDIRVIVIGGRAFAIKRMVREGDFRASGSGCIIYDPAQIPIECLELSFEISEKLNTQCLAYDYIFQDKKLLLVEISYAFSQKGYLKCPGYWDNTLSWHECSFHPEYYMIEDLMREIQIGNE